MRKKILASVLSFALVAGMLTGCGNTSKENGAKGETSADKRKTTEDSGESGEVKLKVWCEEGQSDTVQGMIDSFIENYKSDAKLAITIEHQADAEVRDVLLSDVHNGPDVFSFPDDQLNSLVAGGALAEVPNADEISKANVEESVLAATIGEKLYAYPMTADNGYFLYYNKKYFSEEDVTTLDSILSIAKKKKKKVSMEFNSGWYLYSFFGHTGLKMYLNEDGISNYCNWNSKKGKIKGVDVSKALMRITANPAFAAQADGEWVAQAKKDKVIAAISGTWNAIGVKDAWGADYGACKLPTYTCNGKQVQMASFVGYKMIGVNYYSKNKAWAHKLAEWMTNEQNQTKRFLEQNQGPSNIVAAASDEVSQVPAIAAVMEQAQYGVLQRVGNSYWAACTDYANTIIEGNTNNLPLQKLNDALVSGITQ